MPIDYQKSKIYKLYSPSKNIIYIGSTTETLAQRLAKHKAQYKAYKKGNTKQYYYSFLVLDCEDYKIELLEEYACNNRQQLEKKEGEFIKNNECCNKNIAGRTIKEYADYYKDYYKQYRLDNAEKAKEYKKQYNLDNADKIKARQKQYDIDNADKIKARQEQYRLRKRLEKIGKL